MRKHPLIAFFVLAYLLTWWIYPLLRYSPLLGIFGLFGPALAAIIMAAVTEGKAGVKALLSRVVRWRVGLPWYAVALGLPTVLSLATAALYYLVGASDFATLFHGAINVSQGFFLGNVEGATRYWLLSVVYGVAAVVAAVVLGLKSQSATAASRSQIPAKDSTTS
ncbi:MAG TPA: hypothetical protein VFY56_02545 [Propionibacteriaceae bacterium]|nr:hypothetical protein [Propionibacteriaceae bacterium]